jgi:hypothetical protein
MGQTPGINGPADTGTMRPASKDKGKTGRLQPQDDERSCGFFFKDGFLPKKDFRGGPFYAYFYGIYQANHQYVMHLDADMLLGGRSHTWVSEAIALFESNCNLMCCSPLPGPPHPENKLQGQDKAISLPEPYAFKFSTMSTRIFMVKKEHFEKMKLKLSLSGLLNICRAVARGNPPFALPEQILSAHMKKNYLERIDFLGHQPGLWSLHPPYRTDSFYNGLPELLDKIKNMDLPLSQYGFYDIVDELCDWTQARENLSAGKAKTKQTN